MNERRAELIYGQVLQRMDMTRETGDEELQELIRMTLEEASEKEYLPLNEKIELSRELFHAFRKLDILQELLEDPKITEIMVNGTDHIFYEKGGRLFRSERKFMSEERLVDVIQQIVGEANRYVSEASPIVDARLKDGSRVNVVMKPVAVNGPILTIRTFPEEPLTMKKLIDCGSMTEEAAQFIRKLVIAKYNIFVSGGTGAGKTTFLTIAGGLQTPTNGDVKINDSTINSLSKKQQTKLRLEKIGFILQSYNLVPFLTVEEQFKFVDKLKKQNLTEQKLHELLSDLGLLELLKKYPNQLSGGQKQRVAIARALYTDPDYILADEPTAALDTDRSMKVIELLRDLAHKRNKIIIVVTHDLRLKDMADKVYQIIDGKMTILEK